ncbi:hypothetical protein Syun_029285 [Stephania yunnanensis]|uniref:Bifunctional inhibitor/plant lipid transfer protein/seed storage helical domain-containing protein n=1 Tax=Stephania yunnanensis TaxID=152371 RepID=A0AAP0E5B5_9MAGN
MEAFHRHEHGFRCFSRFIITTMVISSMTLFPTSFAQITTPCTLSMISSFTPCMNFITGSSGNGSSSPTSDCCGSLRSLMSSSMECACLVVTASVPLNLPINRTLAISLPRACKMDAVPIQCKASGAPLPAPGTSPFGRQSPPLPSAPSPNPSTSSTGSVVPQALSPNEAQDPGTTSNNVLPPLAPPTTTTDTPSAFPGRRPVVTPSSAFSNLHYSPTLVFMFLWFTTAALLRRY